MTSSGDSLTLGAALGKYHIEKHLGSGASGTVYIATCIEAGGSAELKAGAKVALKVLHPHLTSDAQLSKRFRRESIILRHMHGEHLVRVLDYGEIDGYLYTALELVPGEALDQVMKRELLDIPTAIRITQEICTALAAAHACGVIHRDLKPANVMLEAPSGRVRVLDFGMAKVLHGADYAPLTVLTERNMVFGTPEYMAPEQARGDEVDERSDIYATGVILYELLSGQLPFKSNTPLGLMTAHLVDEPPPPSSQAPERNIPPALEAIALHALAKDPRDRYPCANSLFEALDAARSNPEDSRSAAPEAVRIRSALALRDTLHDLPPERAASRQHKPSDQPPSLEEGETKRAGEPQALSEPPIIGPNPGTSRQPEPSRLEVGELSLGSPARPSNRRWLVVACVAGLIGILIGVLLSLGTPG